MPEPAAAKKPKLEKRFRKVTRDIAFRQPKISEVKTVVDERFTPLFNDERFTSSMHKDIYGRGLVQRNDDTDPTRNLALSKKAAAAIGKKRRRSGQSDSSGSEKFTWNAASSSEESEDESESLIQQLGEDVWSSSIKEAPLLEGEGAATTRISIMGCDWDNITAVDILVMCHSFVTEAKLTKSGSDGSLVSNCIKRARIYPSQFGRERMAEEAVNGPRVEYKGLFKNDEDLESDDDNVEPEEVDQATALAIRKYEKERSNYFYAVCECVNLDISTVLYEELDGLEADFAVDGLDIRFVPDDLREFPFPPTSEAVSVPAKYSPPLAFSIALRHSKAKLTWDEAPAKRTKILRKRFNAAELAELDLKEYIASCSSEESTGDEGIDRKALYSELLNK